MEKNFAEDIINELNDGRSIEHRKAVAEAVTRGQRLGKKGSYDTWTIETENPRNDDTYLFEEIKWQEEDGESHKYRVIKDNDWEYHLHEQNSINGDGYIQEFNIEQGLEERTYDVRESSDFKKLWKTFNKNEEDINRVGQLDRNYAGSSDLGR